MKGEGLLFYAGSGSSHVLDVGLSTRQGPYASVCRVTDTFVSLFRIFFALSSIRELNLT